MDKGAANTALSFLLNIKEAGAFKRQLLITDF